MGFFRKEGKYTMKKYCEKCEKEVNAKIITKHEKYDVCGENIEVDAKVLVCAECGEELFDEKLDNATLLAAYNEYRRKHQLLLPEEIKAIRMQYGLSQRSFARLLNWGEKTICRYENGSIQDKAHNSLLLFLRKPENMKTYLTENEISIQSKTLNKLFRTIDRLEKNEEDPVQEGLIRHFFAGEPCEENGFREFDYEKLCAMVLFFVNENKKLLKTKLMKLLNYSDMIFYKENGISITGTKYVHLPYGPVPEHFDILLGTMAADHIVHIDIAQKNGYEYHQVISDEKMPKGILSADELKVMKRIQKKFKDYGSVRISDYSHKEMGYKETKTGEIISYAYAKNIRMDG
jgi:putative zinc finger/helix-turn-helix YgiT family protein